MIIPLHNTHILSKITRNYPIVCILRRTRARTAEAVFLEKNAEVPILAVTDKENVDIIGPPDPVSNLRPIIRKRLLHETTLQRKLRHLQDDTQAWNQNFWTEHNTKFVEQRQSFVKTYLGKVGENRTLTADEMSEFYKKFLDENWRCHFRYNFQWYRRNFELLVLALVVNLENVTRSS